MPRLLHQSTHASPMKQPSWPTRHNWWYPMTTVHFGTKSTRRALEQFAVEEPVDTMLAWWKREAPHTKWIL
eukprot:11156714-Lingulodinium_polyedra.AAC.1